jgi:putative nucleotidyltransferase with HDIG domain
MKEELTYEKVIDSLKEKLPSLPQILEELINKLSDPNSNVDSIQELVEIDQAITAEILKVANKVEFIEPDEPRIVTIHDALQKIGFENAKRIALNVTVLKLMKITKFPINFCCEQLWQHSLGVAVASSELAELIGFENPDQAYTCGLVHDIGKLIKVKYSHRAFAKEIASAHRKKIDLHDVEKLRSLLRHDEMGFLMMKFWRMPLDLALTVRWHHIEDRGMREGIESSELHQLIDIVYFANLIINKLQIGYSGHQITKIPSEKFLRSFGLDKEKLELVENNIREKYEQSCPSLLLL